ncbi:hypothetical protein R1flu_029161 [Riccia fluitans]|uniref:Uncharacterized protein n=1 Tax=Riccia fluitans TaxID=41844 RepID=A0ABD1XST2_9MARC
MSCTVPHADWILVLCAFRVNSNSFDNYLEEDSEELQRQSASNKGKHSEAVGGAVDGEASDQTSKYYDGTTTVSAVPRCSSLADAARKRTTDDKQ